MINHWLFIFSIPLSLIGYLLKNGTKIHNKLIPIILAITSCTLFSLLGPLFGFGFKTALVNGFVVTFATTYGWDFSHGIKTVISEVTAQAHKLINIDKEGTMDNLKKWHKTLLSNLLTVIVSALVTLLVCYIAKISTGSSVDMALLATVFVSGGILILDLVKKIVTKDPTLNTQYGICFGFGVISIGALFIAYIAPTWFVTIVSASIFATGFALSLFTVRYSYLPSLRSKEEVIQTLMKERWAEYNALDENGNRIMSDEAVNLRMQKDVKYYFKKDKWGAEVNLNNPMFLDSENNPISVEDATNSNGSFSEDLIAKAVDYLKKIVATREVK